MACADTMFRSFFLKPCRQRCDKELLACLYMPLDSQIKLARALAALHVKMFETITRPPLNLPDNSKNRLVLERPDCMDDEGQHHVLQR